MTEPVYGPEVYSQKLVSAARARKFISQNSRGYIAISIQDAQNNAVDPESLALKVWFNDLSGNSTDPQGELVINVDLDNGIVRDEVGKYHYDIGPQWTAQRGLLHAEWFYEVDDADFVFQDDMQIQEQMPYYDAMREDTKVLVEQASWFFSDLFDSTTGGPWLNENFQTHFDYNRIAFLMHQGLMKLNVIGYPVTAYGVSPDSDKIPKNFTQLALWATKLEAIRHLIVSYTEQPNFANMSTTYTDRRDYADRWRAVLEEEKPEFTQAVKMAKRSLLSLGRGSILVGGGIYSGGARGFYMPGMYSAQARSMRFYPAAPSVSWGNQAMGGSW
ncbi:hypothetical protein SEA_PIER_126 [Mycobacterium phage Pier]|nr:hypothetical protein SEA_PIER_126 [Mycobacterium phage Pier]